MSEKWKEFMVIHEWQWFAVLSATLFAVAEIFPQFSLASSDSEKSYVIFFVVVKQACKIVAERQWILKFYLFSNYYLMLHGMILSV